jgi:CHAT domain-containing protein
MLAPESVATQRTYLICPTFAPEMRDTLSLCCARLRIGVGKLLNFTTSLRSLRRRCRRPACGFTHILHFATHGVLAGQLEGTREPGLILTPPATATVEDDGYLSGSEIAALKLDAEWVILLACNTAGGAGEGEAAEALSGLARVLLRWGAGAARSHWEVDSAATVKLITTAVGELAKDKSLGRAEALRRAMLSVMADTSRPANWVPAYHPSDWAPFVVVGEGCGGR